MKKILSLALMLLMILGARASDNITGALKVDADNKTATLHVSLTNDLSYVAFQMDMTLPEGWTVMGDTPVATPRLINNGTTDLSKVGGTETESTNFLLDHNMLTGNKIRIIGYNLGNAAIIGKKGDEIFTVKLTKSTAAANVTDWKGVFSNVTFVTEADLEEVKNFLVSNPNNTVTGEEAATWKKGDVNHDNVVNVNDVSITINKALGKTVDKFFVTEADIDNNTTINVNDVSAIINIALGKIK